jgi:hypothetical protein
MEVQLTPSQKQQYATEGYLSLPRLLDAGEVARLRCAIEDLGHAGFNLQARQVGALTQKDPRFLQLVFNPKVSDIIGQLVDWDRIFLHSSKVNFNCAHDGVPKTWHQDNVYWPEVPPNQITMWIAIDDADASNGCMWVLPRSHHHGVVKHTQGDTGWEIAEEEVPRIFPGLTPLQCPVAAGGALVFHGNVLHKSEANRSARNRWALVLDFDDRKNQIVRINRKTNMMTQFDSLEIWRRSRIIAPRGETLEASSSGL